MPPYIDQRPCGASLPALLVVHHLPPRPPAEAAKKIFYFRPSAAPPSKISILRSSYDDDNISAVVRFKASIFRYESSFMTPRRQRHHEEDTMGVGLGGYDGAGRPESLRWLPPTHPHTGRISFTTQTISTDIANCNIHHCHIKSSIVIVVHHHAAAEAIQDDSTDASIVLVGRCSHSGRASVTPPLWRFALRCH